MSSMKLIFCALAAFIAVAAADDDSSSSPLVWICLGLTVAGVAVAGYYAYRAPAELSLPGSTVMTAQEGDDYDNVKGTNNSEPTGATV